MVNLQNGKIDDDGKNPDSLCLLIDLRKIAITLSALRDARADYHGMVDQHAALYTDKSTHGQM